MERFKVTALTEKQITFASIEDMEAAYTLLADGRDIILYQEEGGQKQAQILPGKVSTDIAEGRLRLASSEEL